MQLVTGHNEYLLTDLNSALESYRRPNGLIGMIRELFVPSNVKGSKLDEALDRLQQRFARSFRLLHYIPNIFRYPTEQLHYDLLTRAGGLDAQRGYLEKLDATTEQTLGNTVREAAALENRRSDLHLQRLLGAVGLLQVGGTFASLIAVWPQAGLWACLLKDDACIHAENAGSGWLLWLVVVAMALGLLLVLLVGWSIGRHWNGRWRIPNSAELMKFRKNHV